MASLMARSDCDRILLDKIPSVKDLCELMKVDNWYQLAIYLDMNPETLSEIEADNVRFPDLERKRIRMFELWLKNDGQIHGMVTHRKAIDALAKIDYHKAIIYEDTIVQRARGHDIAESDSELQSHHVASLTMPKIIEMTNKVRSTPELNIVASQLQFKFCKLLVFIQSSCQNAQVGAMKNVLISTLSLELAEQQQWPIIAQCQQEIKSLQTVDDIFMFLTEKNFIGCLNYRLLQVFSIEYFCKSKSRKAVKKLSKYQKLFEKLIEIPQFCRVIELLDESPGVHPKPVIGLPIILVKLNETWKHKNKKELDQWVPFLQENKLLLQSMRYKCILITYAVFPKDVPDVVKFMEDKDNLKKLKENGITLEVSTEAYEIAQNLIILYEKEDETLTIKSQLTQLENDNHKRESIDDVQTNGQLDQLIEVKADLDAVKESCQNIKKEIRKYDKELIATKQQLEEQKQINENMTKQREMDLATNCVQIALLRATLLLEIEKVNNLKEKQVQTNYALKKLQEEQRRTDAILITLETKFDILEATKEREERRMDRRSRASFSQVSRLPLVSPVETQNLLDDVITTQCISEQGGQAGAPELVATERSRLLPLPPHFYIAVPHSSIQQPAAVSSIMGQYKHDAIRRLQEEYEENQRLREELKKNYKEIADYKKKENLIMSRLLRLEQFQHSPAAIELRRELRGELRERIDSSFFLSTIENDDDGRSVSSGYSSIDS